MGSRNKIPVTLYRAAIGTSQGCPSGKEPPFQFFDRGGLAVDSAGKILAVGAYSDVRKAHARAPVTDLGESLILPGFVDTHLHFPQIDLIGALGEGLIGWLDRYTFPREIEFSKPRVAQRGAQRFIDELLSHGTTTASIFSSTSLMATEALFREADHRGIRAVIGMVSMDRGAPHELLKPAEKDLEETETLISHWHEKSGRLFYSLTPRFAISCTPELLSQQGKLYRNHPSLRAQTHFSETHEEISEVKRLFPSFEDYLAVYDRHSLLGPRTILAHAIHATSREKTRLSATGTAVSHCPTSNLFLGSGLMPTDEWEGLGVRLGLGTDIGGGTSFSLWQTMAEANKVARLRGRVISASRLFYWATLGGAEALSLGEVTGSLEVGKSADFQVLDLTKNRLLIERWQNLEKPENLLGALMHLADDRLVSSVYICGKRVLGRPITPSLRR